VARLGRLGEASAALDRAIGRLVEASPEAMSDVEREFRSAEGILGGLRQEYEGMGSAAQVLPPEERTGLMELRRRMAQASRLLHQSASVQFSLGAQMFGSAESYGASGRANLAVAPGPARMLARG
jgi:hypothetical protein